MTRKRPLPCDPLSLEAPRRSLGGPSLQKGPAFRRFIRTSRRDAGAPRDSAPRATWEIQRTGSGLGTSLIGWGCRSLRARWEGKQRRACALVPVSPRSRPVLSSTERDARLPWRPGPFFWADGGVLGPGGRPSFSVFNEPRCACLAAARPDWLVRLPGRQEELKTPPRPSPLRGEGARPPSDKGKAEDDPMA